MKMYFRLKSVWHEIYIQLPNKFTSLKAAAALSYKSFEFLFQWVDYNYFKVSYCRFQLRT